MPLKGPKNILEHWEQIQQELEDKQILLFLDYDGTLAPIAARPQLAMLPVEIKEVLKKLIGERSYKVFIVSGRSLVDVKKLVGIKNIVYVGNHGLEIEGANIDFGSFSFARFRETLEYLKWQINKELTFFKGAFVEDKGLGLSVHYRLIKQKDESVFRVFLESIMQEFLSKNEIRIIFGKKVIEIRPPLDWDKGKSVMWLLKSYENAINKHNTLAVYIGDDQTDEDAFKALHKIGLTICVGDSPQTAAEYYLESPQEVAKFLRCLVDLKGRKKESISTRSDQ